MPPISAKRAYGLAYGLVGDGRLARHLGHYFTSLQIPLVRWSRKGNSSPLGDLKNCSTILLAVSDKAIEPVARMLREEGFARPVLVHFSGALFTPLAFGFHPLTSFGSDLYPADTYKSIPFVGESGAPEFHALFPDLPNPSYTIDPAQKALYHALCVMSGNFSALLWTKLLEDFHLRLGIPPEAALPYMKQVSANLATHPRAPRDTWTGPLVRGDDETLKRHLDALKSDPYEGVYRAFIEAFRQQTERYEHSRF